MKITINEKLVFFFFFYPPWNPLILEDSSLIEKPFYRYFDNLFQTISVNLKICCLDNHCLRWSLSNSRLLSRMGFVIHKSNLFSWKSSLVLLFLSFFFFLLSVWSLIWRKENDMVHNTSSINIFFLLFLFHFS